jgi:pyrroloquinoline-quinone synthase
VTTCPACRRHLDGPEMLTLAEHLTGEAGGSDPGHVRWLNQNLTRRRTEPASLVPGLDALFVLGAPGIKGWIIERFVRKFYGPVPHPFVLALQHPSRSTLLGYVVEHQHFLRQWVRSCAFIMARTDRPEVVQYELDNLTTEFGGTTPERVPHYELLLRMGESLGLDRSKVLAYTPLPATQRGIDGWQAIAMQEHWVSALAALHSLELVANRNLREEGASMTYFDPQILQGTEISAAAQAFLREGYEADVGHSGEALDLVAARADSPALRQEVQAVVLRSFDLFDDYLIARLERGREFEG